MKKIYKMMLAVALLCSATWQVVAQAVVVPPTDGSYFYIQFTRGTNLVVQNQGSTVTAGANQLKAADLVFGKAAQLWKAVSNGTGGYYFVSKSLETDGVTELAMSFDATAGKFIVSAYPLNSTPFYTTTTGITTNALILPGCAITRTPGDNQGLNPNGGSVVGATMAIWYINDDGNAVRFVTESSTKILLQDYLTQVNAVSSSASLNPGNHAADVIAAFRPAIVVAQTVYNNAASTIADYVTAGNTLRDALIAYNAAPYAILPGISSADASNEKWYFFQGTRPTNTYMTSTGAGASVFSKTEIPDDTQLWKIVNNTNPSGTLNGYALVNKMTGEYLNTDPVTNSVLNTQPTMPVKNVVLNISTIMTSGVARFWVENAGTTSASTTGFTFRLHAGDGVNNAKNWYGDRTDNSSWLLMDYSISLKTFLKDAITAANVVVNDPTIPVGILLGQYIVIAKVNLAAAVTVAQAVYDNASTTDAHIKTAMDNLNAATIIYYGKRGDAVISTAENPRWFVIRNLFRKDINGVLNHLITTNGVLENGGMISEVLANANEQLWRFEANATGGVKIINGAKPTLGIQEVGFSVQHKLVAAADASGYIIDILGTGYKLTSTAGYPLYESGEGTLVAWNDVAGTATNWAIEERDLPLFLHQTITFDAIPAKLPTAAAFDLAATTDLPGGSVTYTSSNPAVATVAGSTVTILSQGTSDITASNAGDATYAKASVKKTLTVSVFTGILNAIDGISVVVKNRIIVVTGTDASVKAFTVTGAEVDAKRALAQGIYIVEVAGKRVKVNVR